MPQRTSSPFPIAFASLAQTTPAFIANFQGTNGATTYTSESGSIMTSTGGYLSNVQSPFGGTSLRVSPAIGQATMPHNSYFDFGTGDFTIETWAWINQNSGEAAQPFLNIGDVNVVPGAWELGIFSNQTPFFYSLNGEFINYTGSAMTPQTWIHYAMVRSSSILKLYINGILRGSVASTSSFMANQYLLFGRRQTTYAPERFDGYIGPTRIAKTAIYTSNFTPPIGLFT